MSCRRLGRKMRQLFLQTSKDNDSNMIKNYLNECVTLELQGKCYFGMVAAEIWFDLNRDFLCMYCEI